ncbi:MAG: hypothetical protein QG608_3216 [Actinomycetota bacterium]|nr:hypothetical protein [Actinomycetota bacterium]
MRRSLLALGLATAAALGLAVPAHADSYGPTTGTAGAKVWSTSLTANNFRLTVPVTLTMPCRNHYLATRTVRECDGLILVAYDSAGAIVGATDEDQGKKPGKVSLYIVPELFTKYGRVSVHAYNLKTEKLVSIQRIIVRGAARVTASGTRSGAILTVKGTANRYTAKQYAFKAYPSAKVVVQRLVSGKWTSVGQATANSKGTYSVKIKKPKGTYRAVISSTATYSVATSSSFSR